MTRASQENRPLQPWHPVIVPDASKCNECCHGRCLNRVPFPVFDASCRLEQARQM